MKLALLTYVLVSFIAVPAALPTDNERTLNKRQYKKCSCTVAKALFDDHSATAGPIRGITFFTQDEYGKTTVSGLFHKGFNPAKKQTYKIADACGHVIHDLTSDLIVPIRSDGGSEYFSHTFDFSLNCGPEGILSTPTKPCYNKCSSGGGPAFEITSNGDSGEAYLE